MAALLVANTLLWPMARFLNDKFVPEEHRVTANHIMTVRHHSPVLQCRCVLLAGREHLLQHQSSAVQSRHTLSITAAGCVGCGINQGCACNESHILTPFCNVSAAAVHAAS